jgi:hypothetical protein
LCIDEAGIKYREGITQHQVKQELSIGSFVSMIKIGEIIPYFSEPVQIILHYEKNGRFSSLTKDCVVEFRKKHQTETGYTYWACCWTLLLD